MNEQLLIIGSVWPEPGSSAAGQRMMELIHVFKANGWDITVASTAAETPYMTDLQSQNIDAVPVKMNSSTFDDFITGLQPTAVLFDRFMVEEQFGWRVAEQCPEALRILDTEDLHCLRRSRRKAAREGREWKPQDLLHNETAKREVASILRSDCSLIISEYEMTLLQDLFGVDAALLHYLPFMLEPLGEQTQETWPAFDDRLHFMTIGNFRHSPNMDSVRYLRESVWPLIRRQLPEARLYIFGAYPSPAAKALHQPDEGFYIEGRAKSMEDVMQRARVCLAPLRFGAGLKGKLIGAMLCGTPSVTTSVGAEGIAGNSEWPGIIADSPEELAQAAVKLYTNETTWYEAQKRGAGIIKGRFNGSRFAFEFMKRVDQVRANLERHREANFTGAMLMHHTAASTKYMSRWIEAKNR